MPEQTVHSEFFALVRSLGLGYQFIQDTPDFTVNVFQTASKAFRAAKRINDPADIKVARVQIIRQAK